MGNLVKRGESAALMVAIMFVGSLVLWVAMPLGALYVGSKVQAATDSLGVAVLAMAGVVIGSLVVLLPFLNWLNRKHMEVRVESGRQDLGTAALEGVLVVSAGLALLAFGIWFFFFAGASPLPFHGGE